jgi:hypothetical protein
MMLVQTSWAKGEGWTILLYLVDIMVSYYYIRRRRRRHKAPLAGQAPSSRHFLPHFAKYYSRPFRQIIVHRH